jgi:metal-responsive CopG/Arc/MetJ family transcriptional regulator
MKTAISLPDPLFEEAEAAAKDLGLSRSKLIQTALEEFLGRRKASETTRRLNESYATNPPEPDPLLDHLVVEGMKRAEWKE